MLEDSEFTKLAQDWENSYNNEKHLVKNDPVNHPSHYTFSKFEVLDVLVEWFPDSPLLWQVVKYVARARHKGNYLEDLKKARYYLDYEINSVERKGNK